MNQISSILDQTASDLFPADDSLITTEPEKEISIQNNSLIEENIDKDKLKSLLYSIKNQVDTALRLLNNEIKAHEIDINQSAQTLETGEKIIEGVFNGEKMVGADGQEYSIPPNYASKSKLVEGDIMKLTITKNGKFIFKQIGPIERKRLVGELVGSENEQWSVLVDGKTYKTLMASISFFKGKAGDEVVILVPQEGTSAWGAVDNIIHQNT